MLNKKQISINYDGISSTPIFFKLRPNTKRPIDNFKTVLKSKTDINFNLHNVGFRTGEISNTTVIDLDIYKKEINSDNFIKHFGLPENFIESFNTLTQATPRGGIHLIFQYDGDLKQTTSEGIDIRNDGGYIVFYPSSIDKKPYIILNETSIKKIPDELKEWLLNNLYKKSKPKSKIINELNDFNNQTLIKYLTLPKEVLNNELSNLPEQYLNNYQDWFKFTCLMKHLNQKKLWDEMSKKGKGYNEIENKKIWEKIDINNYISFAWKILKESCNSSILNIIQYKEYYETLPEPNKTIDIKYLSDKIDIKDFNCSLVIKSDTGTGKTTLFKKYIMETKQKFISIGSRMALVDEQQRVFNESNINIFHYKDIKAVGYVPENENIVTTIDSIGLLHNIDDFRDYILFLDEFNSLIEYIFMADKCLNNKRLTVLTTLIYIMKSCKQIIATDADISNICFRFMDYIGTDFKYILNTHKHNTGIEFEELESLDEIVKKINECHKDEKNYLVCCDTKKYADYIYTKTDKHGTLHTSDNQESLNIQNEKHLIISPKIIYGNDSTIGRTVFCVYNGSTITPSNMLQQINRERNISKVYLYFEERKYNTPLFNDKNECSEYVKLLDNKASKEFKMIDINLSKMFNEIYSELIYRYDCYNSNKYCHLINLLKKRGFVINPLYIKNTKPKKKEIKEKVNEFRDEIFNLEKHKEIIEILKLDEENILKYKNVLIDQHSLTKHFNIVSYLFKNVDNNKILDKLEKVDDFPIKKLMQDKKKMVLLKQFEEETNFNLFDDETAKCNKPLDKNTSLKWNNEIKACFGFTRKNMDFTDVKQCTKQIFNCYYNLFGPDIMKGKERKIKGTQKNETIYLPSEEAIKYHRELYELRKPIKNTTKKICVID